MAGAIISSGQSLLPTQQSKCKLQPEPLHYDAAPECFRMFEELQHTLLLKLPLHPVHGDQWRIYFRDAIRHVDTLVGLQKQVENGEIKPTMDDLTLAYRYTRSATESLRKMEQHFDHSPAWHNHVQQKDTLIIRQLGTRRLYIQDLIRRNL